MARRRQLPVIPTQVACPAGPVPVVRVKNLAHEGEPCYGLWDRDRRVISLDASLKREAAWRWLLHEQYHAWLDDANIILKDSLTESIVDALACAHVNAMWWSLR